MVVRNTISKSGSSSKKIKVSHIFSNDEGSISNSMEEKKDSEGSSVQEHVKIDLASVEKVDVSTLSPMDYLKFEIRHKLDRDVIIHCAMDIDSFFHEPTKEEIESYDIISVSAIRSGNIEKLRELLKSGKSLQCCNRFGESLVHMACRRGFTDVVTFLIKEAGVNVKIRDDFGRTPLHDACWTSQPNFALVDTLIREEPRLLLICDKRGFTPFQYTRKEHWKIWRDFLSKKINEICESKDKQLLFSI